MQRIEAAGSGGARRRRGGAAVLTVLVGVAMAATACSSSSTSSSTTIDTKAAPGLIATAYQTLFNFSDKTVPSKVAVIQNGSTIESSLQEALASPLSSTATGAKIDSTQVLTGSACTNAKVTSPCAKVKYDLLGAGGSPVLGGQTGYAVYENGEWLVAKVTICGLLELFYSAESKQGVPPGC